MSRPDTRLGHPVQSQAMRTSSFASRRRSRTVLPEKLQNAALLLGEMLWSFPVHQLLDFRQQPDEFGTDHRRMRCVVSWQHHARHGATPYELAANAENEVAAPHVTAECLDCGRVKVAAPGMLLRRPFAEAVREIGRVFGMEADRI